MERRFGILVLLVTLTQICFAVDLTLYGIPEDKVAAANDIFRNQDLTLAAKFGAINPVFDVLNELSAGLIWGPTTENGDTVSIIAEALAKAKESIDYPLSDISTVLQTNCSAVETGRNNAYANLDDVYTFIPEAIELATTSGSYSEKRAGIDELLIASRKSLDIFVDNILGTIPICLNEVNITVDENTLAAIEIGANGSKEALFHTINGVFNGIKRYAVAVSDENQDVSLVSAIEDDRSYTMNALKNDVEHKYSVLRAIFLKVQLGLDIPLTYLFEIQYTQAVTTYRFNSAIDTLFNTINDYLRSVDIGLSNAGQSVFSKTDEALAVTSGYFEAGLRVAKNSVVKIEPSVSAAADKSLKYLLNLSNRASEGYYSAIVTTQTNISSCEVLEKIEQLKTKNLAQIPDFVAKLFELITNNETFGDQVDALIAYNKRSQIAVVTGFSSYIWDAIFVLANATAEANQNGIEDNFTAAIEDLQNSASSSIDDITHGISYLLSITISARASRD